MALSSIPDVEKLLNGDLEEDIYGTGSSTVEFDVLIPNGLMICELKIKRKALLKDLKMAIFHSAKNLPLWENKLKADKLMITYLDGAGMRKEICTKEDEEKLVSSIQPFLNVIRIEKMRNTTHSISKEISKLVDDGTFANLNSIDDDEIKTFKKESERRCIEWTAQANSANLNDKLLYLCPPDVCEEPKVLETLTNMYPAAFKIQVIFSTELARLLNSTESLESVALETKPSEIVKMLIGNQRKSSITRHDCALKICGTQEFLVTESTEDLERPLWHYTDISKCLMRNQTPKFNLLKKSDVVDPKPSPKPRPSQTPGFHMPFTRSRRDIHAHLLRISERYILNIIDVCHLTDKCNYIKAGTEVRLELALYHGVETLCDILNAPEKIPARGALMLPWYPVKDGRLNPEAERVDLFRGQFDIEVRNLPRNARLCITLWKQAPRTTPEKVFWANFCLFNYQGRLETGTKKLSMWPFDDEKSSTAEPFKHLGTCVNNPQSDAPVIELKLHNYLHDDKPILYPSQEEMTQALADHRNNHQPRSAGLKPGPLKKYSSVDDDSDLRIKDLVKRTDRLSTLYEQDKQDIWRLACTNYLAVQEHENWLPVILRCLRWNQHQDVAQMRQMLENWKLVKVETALELLDCMYADQAVRKFAVNCLRKVFSSRHSESELCRYLLQLVQTLKYESYMDCELVWFLLERAISNRKLGHYFFWLLKSEMHNPSVHVWFRLIIESYCHARVDHIPLLMEQSQQLEALSKLTHSIFKLPKNSKRDALKNNLEMEKQTVNVASTSISAKWKLLTIKPDNCKPMDSKKQPLRLTFSNDDKNGTDFIVIYKQGDDLRQDMLTLQVMQVMDNLWMKAGLDLRMNVYDCLATGNNQGMIEVVQNAETLCDIMKGNYSSRVLYDHLKTKNHLKEDLQTAINEFSLSCAGYCVATFVLGIGDRHHSNIMMKSNGQFFHIDFGHFLGNIKKKWGVKRETAPFIFVPSFKYVIEKLVDPETGNEDPVKAYNKFKERCVDAFQILRSNSDLLVSLFMMMVSTGIPQLQSLSDVEFLKRTLMLEKSDTEARSHFLKKLDQSLHDKRVHMNWRAHDMAHKF